MITTFPSIPNYHALFAIVMMVYALFLFTRPKLRLEISSMVILSILALAFSLFPIMVDGKEFLASDFFHGFGHEALVAVCALMVIGQALVQTGALEPFGRMLTKIWRIAPFFSALMTLLVGAILSAFINNTPIVVLLLPILLSIGIRTGGSASKFLMPMGFATIVGGMSTTIGTSTNLLVVSVANDLGLEAMGMFDFFVPAAIVAGIAILYLWLIAPLLLPKTEIGLSDISPRVFQARLVLNENSPAVGHTIAEATALVSDGFQFHRVRRGDNYLFPLPDVVLQEGDRLRVRDTASNIRAAAGILRASLYSGDVEVDDDHPLNAENQTVAEIAIVQESKLAGQNLRYARFLEEHQLIVLALHRAGRDIWKEHEEIMDVTLQPSDVLMVQGDKGSIKKLKQNTEFLVLDATEPVHSTSKAPIALLILFTVILVSALGILPIAISAMVGAMLLLGSRSLKLGAAIRAINSTVVFVVVASLAIGQSLEITGASFYMTEVFLYFFQDASPTVVMSSLMLLIGILTNIVSNNAAAIIGTPIAVSLAQQIGAPPEAFVLAVLFGANLSFATPMSYQTNLLVMNAGNYQFKDFMKVGIPLMLIMWISFTVVLSKMYL